MAYSQTFILETDTLNDASKTNCIGRDKIYRRQKRKPPSIKIYMLDGCAQLKVADFDRIVKDTGAWQYFSGGINGKADACHSSISKYFRLLGLGFGAGGGNQKTLAESRKDLWK